MNFLELYPVFQRYDLDLFQSVNSFWESSIYLKQQTLHDLSDGTFDYDEVLQLKEYLAER